MPKIHYRHFPINGIWEMTQQTQRTFACANLLRFVTDLSFMLRTCYGEVANLLRTCYGETGVMDFGLLHTNMCLPQPSFLSG